MSEKYFDAPGLNSTLLSKFCESQDHALIVTEQKHVFSLGHAFEDVLWLQVFGDSSRFDSRFFVADLGTPPDKIVQAIESGGDISGFEVLTKAGVRSKTHATTHAWIDACADNPGLKPISKTEYEALCAMATNLLKAEIEPGTTVADIIGACEWQVPIFWDRHGIKKKALIDLLLRVGEETYIFDIKTTASLGMFKKMLRTKYWVQDCHYWEGTEATYGPCEPMTFLVAAKDNLNLAQAFRVDQESRINTYQKYLEKCQEFAIWDAAGRPAKGWKELEEVKIYI